MNINLIKNDSKSQSIIKDIYSEILLSKKLIFDFKCTFLNNNYNLKSEVIAIRKYVLFNIFDSFNQTLKNIEEKIFELEEKINLNLKNIYNLNEKSFKNEEINNLIEQRKPNQEIKNNNNYKEYYSSDIFKNNKNNDLINHHNKIKQNTDMIKYLNKKNNKLKVEFSPKEIDLSSKINNNYKTKENNNINIDLYHQNSNKKSLYENINYNCRNPGTIIKKINTFNTEKLNYINKNNINNNENPYNNNLKIKEQNLINQNNIIYNYNYPYINNGSIVKSNSYVSENINSNNYLNKNNILNDTNNKYYKNEKAAINNRTPNIKIKNPIREVIKKLIKNQNQINESFNNYCNLTNALQNKSFDLNNNNINNEINIKNNDILIDKIKNSENLRKYFSEKYGEGDFNKFFNKYKKGQISKELIKNEIFTVEKIIEKNNNLIQNYNKKNLGNSSDFIKSTQNKIKRKRNHIKNRTIDHKDKNKIIYRTGTPSNRESKIIYNHKNNFSNKKGNFRKYHIASSFVSNYL